MVVKKLILLVEDDEALALTLKDLLIEQFDFIVHTVKTGQEALEYLKFTIPDIVVSDLMLPSMNGEELYTKMREISHLATVPFIIITSNVMLEQKIKLLEKGVNDYIIKPFPINELLFKIRNIVDYRKKLINYSDLFLLNNKEITSENEVFLKQLNEYIIKNIKNKLTTEELANHCYVSPSTLDKRIRSLTGKNITKYVRELRLEYSLKLIEKGITNVKKLTFESGFQSLTYFSMSFKSYMNITPKQYILKMGKQR